MNLDQPQVETRFVNWQIVYVLLKKYSNNTPVIYFVKD